jgi:hypothetical protein
VTGIPIEVWAPIFPGLEGGVLKRRIKEPMHKFMLVRKQKVSMGPYRTKSLRHTRD